jgi:hypothetical protein
MKLFRSLTNRKKARRASPSAPRSAVATERDFSGVEVIVSPHACCDAAQGLASTRFLVSEMPILPLAACDADYCRCHYQRFDDRRRAPRRAADVGFDIQSHLQERHRRSAVPPGRRDSDQC